MDNLFIKHIKTESNKCGESNVENNVQKNKINVLGKGQQNPNIVIKNAGNSLITGKNVKIEMSSISMCQQQSEISADQKMTVKLKKIRTTNLPEMQTSTMLYPNCSKCGEKLDNLDEFQKRMEGFASNFLMDLICVRCVRQRQKVDADKRKFVEYPIEYLHEEEDGRDSMEETFIVEGIELEYDQIKSLQIESIEINEENENIKKEGNTSFNIEKSDQSIDIEKEEILENEIYGEEYLSDTEYEDYLNSPIYKTQIENFYCSYCCISFQTLHSLITHGYHFHKPEHQINPHKCICDLCDTGYPSLKLLRMHMRRKHTGFVDSSTDFPVDSKQFKNIFECSICHRDFSRFKVLLDHLKNFHTETDENPAKEERIFNCNICDTVYSTYKNLQAHIYYMHSMRGVQKPKKYRKLVRQGNTILMIIAEPDSKPTTKHSESLLNIEEPAPDPIEEKQKFYCSQCCRPYKTRELQLSHEKYCQIPIKYQTKTDFYCKLCKKYYNTKKLLQSHKSYKHGKSQFSTFQCRGCSDELPTRKERLNHERSVHRNSDNGQYECTDCPKKYNDIVLLEAHRFKHTNQTPFICEQCGKGFSNKSALKNHRRTHNPENYKCKLCTAVFKHAASLTRHKQIQHNGIKSVYCCAICLKQYVDVRDLRRHTFTHENNEKNIVCKVCSRRFYLNCDLTRHMRLYHAPK